MSTLQIIALVVLVALLLWFAVLASKGNGND